VLESIESLLLPSLKVLIDEIVERAPRVESFLRASIRGLDHVHPLGRRSMVLEFASLTEREVLVLQALERLSSASKHIARIDREICQLLVVEGCRVSRVGFDHRSHQRPRSNHWKRRSDVDLH